MFVCVSWQRKAPHHHADHGDRLEFQACNNCTNSFFHVIINLLAWLINMFTSCLCYISQKMSGLDFSFLCQSHFQSVQHWHDFCSNNKKAVSGGPYSSTGWARIPCTEAVVPQRSQLDFPAFAACPPPLSMPFFSSTHRWIWALVAKIHTLKTEPVNGDKSHDSSRCIILFKRWAFLLM